MKPIVMDFAVKKEPRKTFMTVFTALFSILALILAGNTAVKFNENQKSIGQYKKKITHLQAVAEKKRSDTPFAVPENLKKEVAFFNTLSKQKNFQWIAILDFLEKACGEGIVLSNLEIHRAKGTIYFKGRSESAALLSHLIHEVSASDGYRLDTLSQSPRSDGAIAFTMEGRITP